MLQETPSLAFANMMHRRHDASDVPSVVSLHVDDTLADVLEALHKYKIHRVWVTDQLEQARASRSRACM